MRFAVFYVLAARHRDEAGATAERRKRALGVLAFGRGRQTDLHVRFRKRGNQFTRTRLGDEANLVECFAKILLSFCDQRIIITPNIVAFTNQTYVLDTRTTH